VWSLLDHMAFSPSCTRAATVGERTPSATACPAAMLVADRIVAVTTDAGTQAEAAFGNQAAVAPLDSPNPRRRRRLASIALPLVPRPARVPPATPSCRAASLRV